MESKEIQGLLAAVGKDGFLQRLAHFVKLHGEGETKEKMAFLLVTAIRPETILPERFADHGLLLADGLRFFLSRQPLKVLAEICTRLLTQEVFARDHASRHELVYQLARSLPTLQKLCQTLARQRGLDPEIKRWLVALESVSDPGSAAWVERRLQRGFADANRNGRLVVETILAEASVAAVARCSFRDGDKKQGRPFAVKTLKPGIRRQLEVELAILEDLADYLEGQKARYGLRRLRLRTLFYDLRDIFAAEIQLGKEQQYLAKARNQYRGMAEIIVPRPLALQSPKILAMEYFPGSKITEADLSKTARRHAAERLCEAMICEVIFSSAPSSLFHGDPHAGNILVEAKPTKGSMRLGLVDWSLAGSLSLELKKELVALVAAIAVGDLEGIILHVEKLVAQGPGDLSHENCRDQLAGLVKEADFANNSLLGKSFYLVGELAFAGVVFPAQLLLFRKALFTLEGVLLDLDEGFDLNFQLMSYLGRLLLVENPARMVNAVFWQRENAEDYDSLLTTAELQRLALQLASRFSANLWQPMTLS